MLKLFKKKTPDYIDLETYDYSSFARDMTEEELLTVNGGKWIGNSDASVAEGEVGDTLRRKDGTKERLRGLSYLTCFTIPE